jgi:hypothetical protein
MVSEWKSVRATSISNEPTLSYSGMLYISGKWYHPPMNDLITVSKEKVPHNNDTSYFLNSNPSSPQNL